MGIRCINNSFQHKLQVNSFTFKFRLIINFSSQGDNVIIINAEKVQLSGNKWEDKTYIRHTGYPGGQRSLTAEELKAKNPAAVVERAVKGMLPKNKLGAELFRNLKVYAGAEHQQEAQKPKTINLNDL